MVGWALFFHQQDCIWIANYFKQNTKIRKLERDKKDNNHINIPLSAYPWYLCIIVFVITFNPCVVLLHIFELLLSSDPQWSECPTHVPRRYSIPLVLLGGPHVCAVTQLDLPKPARLPSRLPASTRPRTQGCTELQALWAESWEGTKSQLNWSSLHLGFTLVWPKLWLLLTQLHPVFGSSCKIWHLGFKGVMCKMVNCWDSTSHKLLI